LNDVAAEKRACPFVCRSLFQQSVIRHDDFLSITDSAACSVPHFRYSGNASPSGKSQYVAFRIEVPTASPPGFHECERHPHTNQQRSRAVVSLPDILSYVADSNVICEIRSICVLVPFRAQSLALTGSARPLLPFRVWKLPEEKTPVLQNNRV